MHAVKLLTGPRLAILIVTNWATLIDTNWPRHFRTIKIGVSGDFWVLSYQFVFFLFPVIFQLSKNSLFQIRGAKIGFFNFQCFKLIF